MTYPKWSKRSMIWVGRNGTFNHCCKCSLLVGALSTDTTFPQRLFQEMKALLYMPCLWMGWGTAGFQQYIFFSPSISSLVGSRLIPNFFPYYFLLLLFCFCLGSLSQGHAAFLLPRCRLPCWPVVGSLSLMTFSFILYCVWACWVVACICVYVRENFRGQLPMLFLMVPCSLAFETISH